MIVRGSKLAAKALEDEGVRFTFGIPGTHNVELYDVLADSRQITPVLVTDEQSASFMADGVSRTSPQIGVVNLVPGAGPTHALSGVAEAFMDQVPLLVLACGVRGDTGHAYQVHDIDQAAMLRPVCKDVLTVKSNGELYALVRRAIRLAKAGPPGPVAVIVPAEFYIVAQNAPPPEFDEPPPAAPAPAEQALERAASLLNRAGSVTLYVGAGARGASDLTPRLAELLAAPAATTIQGKGVFPEDHPLWLWNNFGARAPSFVGRALAQGDCLLAIGCRFGEVATASYGMKPPKSLIHVDIDAAALGRNYPAAVAIQADARAFIERLIPLLKPRKQRPELAAAIAQGHARLAAARRRRRRRDKVTPAALFAALQQHAEPGAIYAADSGNGLFLAMEHLRLTAPGRYIAPVDFSCMGYAVPAAIGAKFANPQRDVIAVAGDGALLMTGLELLTAATYRTAPAVFVLRDRELAQIVQLQRTSFNRDTCSVLGDYRLDKLAAAVNAQFASIGTDDDLERVVPMALSRARAGEPVVVEVAIDYAQKTFFTKSIIETNFWRLPWPERLRMAVRAGERRLPGRG